MDKVMALLVAASVLILTGSLVLFFGVPNIMDLGSTSENVKQDFCDKQIDQLNSEEDVCEQVSAECKRSDRSLMYRCLGEEYEGTLT